MGSPWILGVPVGNRPEGVAAARLCTLSARPERKESPLVCGGLYPGLAERTLESSLARNRELRMPVTARLSKRFYETLGEDVANEMVDWFNAVDTTYKADLRDLIEVQAQRFDAKLEQRLAETRADLRSEISQVRAEVGQVRAEMGVGFAQVRTEMATGSAALRTEMANLRADLVKWMFLFWLGTVAAAFFTR